MRRPRAPHRHGQRRGEPPMIAVNDLMGFEVGRGRLVLAEGPADRVRRGRGVHLDRMIMQKYVY